MIQSSSAKLVIIGLGLIGGSLAAALKKREAILDDAKDTKREIVGIVRRQETADIALQENLVDRAFLSLEEVAPELKSGDIIFIAVPTLSVPNTLADIKRYVSDQVTITDGASVKGSVVEGVKQVYGVMPPQFVPGHPIAGSEKSGVTAANPDLYVDHRIILTPLPETGHDHLNRVADLWRLVEAEVLMMSVEEHDAVLAATSHLPHAIAYSLVDTLANDSENENIFRYAAGGFRDFTRIASSDPTMWHDIMCANSDSVLEAIDLFQKNLNCMRQAIADQNSDALLTIFNRAKVARDEFASLSALPVGTNKSSADKDCS
ncbi:MAG: prephenate dehydrogenase/arogenate dehydrogenase family protein [Cellvibrionaceae bacterium]